jgi:hypothetical protein
MGKKKIKRDEKMRASWREGYNDGRIVAYQNVVRWLKEELTTAVLIHKDPHILKSNSITLVAAAAKVEALAADVAVPGSGQAIIDRCPFLTKR